MSKLTAAEQKKVDAAKEKAEDTKVKVEDVKVKAKTPAGITVKNLRKTWFVQPSTQTRINVGAEVLIADDGWARNQIDAGFFEVVK